MNTTTAEEFLELEDLYREKPGAYRARVMGLVGLGYVYVIGVIAVILGFVVGGGLLFGTGTVSFIWIDNFLKVAIPGLVIAGLMAKSLFVRIPPPEGVYLEGDLKQRVLDYFDEVREQVGGKRIDEVVITNDLNAAVQQLPRFGMFGPTKNFLILGAPLLQLMTADEVRAVVAHEFGHLSHEHGRMGAMVYRLDTTLLRAAHAIDEKSKQGFSGWSYRLFDRFYSRFNKVTFAMRRGQEYEADAAAARVAGSAAIASSLCRLHALGEPIGRYWNELWAEPRHAESNRQFFPHARMRAAVAAGVNAEAAESAVRAGLEQHTDYSDTHPALSDRLHALGEAPVTQFEFTDSALEAILAPDEREQFLALVDRQWQDDATDDWSATRERYQRAESERAELNGRRDELDADGLLRLASLEEDLDGREAAKPTYRTLVERQPDSALAQYHWGRVNLRDDFGTAERALRKSARLDLELVHDIAPMLRYGYEQAGRAADFESFSPVIEQYEELCRAANAERETVRTADELFAFGASGEFLAALKQHLQALPEVCRLFLVEKPVTHFRNDPVYVLGYDVRYMHDNVESNIEAWATRVTNELSARFPGLNNPFWVVLDKKNDWAAKFERIDGALVYEGSAKSAFGLRELWSWFRTGLVFVVLGVIAVVLVKQYLIG